ncbi:hypothetical protein FACS1894187_05100 [Synergistales bacterium]|nr:hypothetical protein FACS1894187_05100 [Synergistales bacterium]
MLSAMQEAFCAAYVADPKRNGTRAALAAGYSKKSARILSSQVLTNINVQKRIKELEREALEEAGYSPESLRALAVRQLASQVSVNVSDIVKVVYPEEKAYDEAIEQAAEADGGQYRVPFGEPMLYVRPTSAWTPEEHAAVKHIKATRDAGVEIVFYDKQAALKMLADIAGITKQSVEVSGAGGQPVAMNLIFQHIGGNKDMPDMSESTGE